MFCTVNQFRFQVKDFRHELVENLANCDDHIGEIFLDEKVPTNEDIHAAIRRNAIKRTFTPVFLGTALKNKGVQPLLDGVLDYLPNPSEVDNFATDNSKVDALDTEQKAVKLRMDPERTSTTPFVGLAFKLEQGKFGQLTYVRVYQGSIKKGDNVYNTRTGKRTRIPRLVQMHSDKMTDVDEVFTDSVIFVTRCGRICMESGDKTN